MMVAGSKKRLPPPVLFSIPSNIPGRPPLCSEHWGTAIESKSQMTTSSYTTRNFSNLISFRSCAVGEHRRPISARYKAPSKLARISSRRVAWLGPPLRTSSDQSFIVGVPRTEGTNQAALHAPLEFLHCSLEFRPNRNPIKSRL